MRGCFFYWTSGNTRRNDLMEFPPLRRENLFAPSGTSWEGGAERKGLACTWVVQPCWLCYLPLIQSSCSICCRGSIQASWKQNLERTRIHAFSKVFFNLKHPSLHSRILLLDCFPVEQLTSTLARIPACGFRRMQATCILTPHHGIIFFTLATAAQPTLLGS